MRSARGESRVRANANSSAANHFACHNFGAASLPALMALHPGNGMYSAAGRDDSFSQGTRH